MPVNISAAIPAAPLQLAAGSARESGPDLKPEAPCTAQWLPCPTARAQGHLRNCESATYNESRDSEVLPPLASQRPRRSAYEAARMPFRLEPRCQPAQTFFPALIPI